MHILFLNPQGNFDHNDSYWTMHPDFGGQLVYVKEIASEMAKMGHHVDIVTRQIIDPEFPEFNEPFDRYEDVDNLRIIRIPCGGKLFLQKELLWEHLDEWTNNILSFYADEKTTIDFMTGHYGDGGLACAMIKQKAGIPYSFTGHSLGAQKLDKLHCSEENFTALNEQYHFDKRIEAERTAMKYADRIFVSTVQEKDEQYKHPLYYDVTNFMNPSVTIVAPPGANTTVFSPGEESNVEPGIVKKIDIVIKRDIAANRQDLPFVILASRLDPKKNHVGLMKAYASSKELQNKTNVAISLRGIENAYKGYPNASKEEANILDQLIEIIQNNQLEGHVMFIDISSQKELAGLYQYLSLKQSVFCLTALYEPFGLAPIEAMSTGLPVAVTKYGGPADVLEENGEFFGVLLDVHDQDDIANGILEVFKKYSYYKKQGQHRVNSKYTWNATARTYLEEIQKVVQNQTTMDVVIHPYFKTGSKSTIDTSRFKQLYFTKDEE